MKIFDTYEKVEEMKPCMKKPLVVHAKQMEEEFRVKTLEGDYKLGKSGDFLMQGIEGELYICDKIKQRCSMFTIYDYLDYFYVKKV